MSKHGLEGVSVVWWFMLIFTICRVYVYVILELNGMSDGNFFPTGIFLVIRTWQNMFWKVFLLFGDLC